MLQGLFFPSPKTVIKFRMYFLMECILELMKCSIGFPGLPQCPQRSFRPLHTWPVSLPSHLVACTSPTPPCTLSQLSSLSPVSSPEVATKISSVGPFLTPPRDPPCTHGRGHSTACLCSPRGQGPPHTLPGQEGALRGAGEAEQDKAGPRHV